MTWKKLVGVAVWITLAVALYKWVLNPLIQLVPPEGSWMITPTNVLFILGTTILAMGIILEERRQGE